MINSLYEEIKRTFDVVPPIFAAMAHEPTRLQRVWRKAKAAMRADQIDSRTKEIVALAVSATNKCQYWVDAQTARLKRRGMSEAAIAEIIAVVELFDSFNRSLDGPALRDGADM